MRSSLVWCGVAGVGISIQAAAGGDTLIWANPSGGSFNDPANWDPMRVPGALDRTVFAYPATYAIAVEHPVEVLAASSSAGGC